jgi:hypothetical protein
VDPIRPIGPVERDLEPIMRITRTPPDAERERREREDGQQTPRRRQAPEPERPAPPEDEGGPSLIDIKV